MAPVDMTKTAKEIGVNNAPKIAEQYLAAWNERGPAARRASTDARFSSVTGILDNAA